jgi:hypothetical protein
MRHFLIGILIGLTGLAIVLAASKARACTNDFQCGLGGECVRPEGSYSMQGMCVRPDNGYGTPSVSPTPHVQSGCSWNTDCPIGSQCVKAGGALVGLCVR